MTELALNLLDIANNSTKAKASLVTLTVSADTKADELTLRIEDDGCGMSAELLGRVTDPFSTTRTTRKVGMGIPLFKMAAEQTGGRMSISSTPGVGTVTEAVFIISSIDRAPLGDVAATVVTLIGGAPQTDFTLCYSVDGRQYVFDTRDVKAALGTEDLSEPMVLSYLQEMIRENTEIVNGGVVL